jgi:hypothetical protein
LLLQEKTLLKETEQWLIIFRNIARRGFLSFGSNGKATLGSMEEASWSILV